MSELTKEQYKELFSRPDWTFETLQKADEIISKIAKDYLKLSWYPNQIEIVSSEQMIDAYSLIGLPTSYPHWKFGKDFVSNSVNYEKGRQGLAYELVINSNPCISYNMEDNTTCLMLLVLAHAAYGHNSFFKNNYMFKQWTDADSIIEDMVYAREFIIRCEDKYGIEEVEAVLDAAHAVQRYGVDNKPRVKKRSAKEEEERRKLLYKLEDENHNVLWSTLPDEVLKKLNFKPNKNDDSIEPEDNILWFIEHNAPNLPLWKREIISIVRNIGQYFYPQAQTKVINEGWASFSHYLILYKMWEEGYLTDGVMIEFLKSHAGVLYQRPHTAFNPYTLGFNIFMDIKRMCENPTEEDKEYFPNLVGKDWVEECHFAMENFRDDSFILQYLSPKVMRDMKIYSVMDEELEDKNYSVTNVQNKAGYQKIKEALYKQYNRGNYMPDIKVTDVHKYEDNRLILTHYIKDGRMLDEEEAFDVLINLQELWSFPIELRGQFSTGEEITIVDV